MASAIGTATWYSGATGIIIKAYTERRKAHSSPALKGGVSCAKCDENRPSRKTYQLAFCLQSGLFHCNAVVDYLFAYGHCSRYWLDSWTNAISRLDHDYRNQLIF